MPCLFHVHVFYYTISIKMCVVCMYAGYKYVYISLNVSVHVRA